MRKLERGTEPPGLAEKRRQKKKKPGLGWADVTQQEKAVIWSALDQMQGGRCAYCECKLEHGKKHIEHFLLRSRHPDAMFDWSNLFGSCNWHDSCGKHKDDQAEEWVGDDLIKPDQDDPEQFLQFFSDGAIRPRIGLTQEQRQRAEETLRVFNLDAESHRLRDRRRQAIAGWLASLQVVQEECQAYLTEGLYTEDEAFAEVQEELDKLLSQTADLPFATAIRHTLLNFG
jgi:uncharacterized protein (TIGR02646 family)